MATTRPKNLREAIEDEELRHQVDTLWDKAKPFHERQSAPYGSASGREHCQAVERNIYRVLLKCGKLTSLHDGELFLLSAAACCHDFDKGLPPETNEDLAEQLKLGDEPADSYHGHLSGRFVADAPLRLGLTDGQAELVDCIVCHHAQVGEGLRKAIDDLRGAKATLHEEFQVLDLFVLLKFGDALQYTGRLRGVDVNAARRSGAAHPEDHEKQLQASIAVFRERARDWYSEGNSVIVPVVPHSPEEQHACEESFAWLRDSEFAPLAGDLQRLHLPHTLKLDVNDRYVTAPAGLGTDEATASPYAYKADTFLVKEEAGTSEASGATASVDPAEAERQVALDTAASRTQGVGDPKVSDVSPRLRAVLRARATALDASAANAELVLGDAEFLGSDCTAFWFLQYLRTPDWLKRISKPLIQLVGQSYGRVHWPAMRMLRDMAKDLGQKDEVLDSGLIEAFWHSAHPFGVNWALLIIEAAEEWQSPVVRELLDEVEELPAAGIQRVAFALGDHAAGGPENADFALRYLVKWFEVTSGEVHRHSQPPAFVSLNRCLHRVMEAQPASALRRAEDLLNSEADAQPEDAARELWRALPSGHDNVLSVQISALLKQAIADHNLREQAAGILSRLAASGELLKQLIVIDVLRDADDETLSRMAGVAESVAVLGRHLQGLQSDWTHYLLGQLFALGEDEVTSRLRSALLELPDEADDEGHRGAVKYFALDTIPPEARTDAVNDALERLCPPSRQEDRGYEPPRKPQDQIRFIPLVDQPGRDVDFGRLLDEEDHEGLLAAMSDVSLDPETGTHYSDESVALRQALEDRPQLIVSTARMMAEAETDIAEDYYEAVATAARTSGGLDGSALLELATAIDRKFTGHALSYVADTLSRKWDDLGEDEQARAVSLVCRWADPAVVSDPTLEWSEEWMARPNTGDAADTGLNSARGGIGVALIEIAGKVEGDLREQALGRIMLLLEDPAVPVRAIMLVWLRNLAAKVDGAWLAEAVAAATRDDDLRVIPCAAELLAHMEIEAVIEMGVRLARLMLTEEGDTASKGGQLAAIWSLKYPDEKQLIHLIDTVLASGNTDAKVGATGVFAFNICAEDERIQATCRERCLDILRTQPPEVRVGAVGNLPSGENAPPLTPALDVLRLAAQDAAPSVLRALWDHVFEFTLDEATARPDVVAAIAAIIEGLLANANEQLQAEFLHTDEGELLKGTYRGLRDGGHEALALDLLDAACYHCVPQAKSLLDEYAKSASPSANPKP